jgi:hypothetical protein
VILFSDANRRAALTCGEYTRGESLLYLIGSTPSSAVNHNLPLCYDTSLHCFAGKEDGYVLVTGRSQGKLEVYDRETGNLLRSIDTGPYLIDSFNAASPCLMLACKERDTDVVEIWRDAVPNSFASHHVGAH